MTIHYAPLIAAAIFECVLAYIHIHRKRPVAHVCCVNRWPAGKVGAL